MSAAVMSRAGGHERRLDLARVRVHPADDALEVEDDVVTSSFTPLIVENSWATPSIRTLVTAAPASEESRTRRSELPNV